MRTSSNAKKVEGKGVKPFPEALTRHDDDPRSWTVEPTLRGRGHASTSRADASMRVPTGDDDLSRFIRAHEMTHAKMSPIDPSIRRAFTISPRSIEVMEEVRITALLDLAGFEPKKYADGSEKNDGRAIGKSNREDEAIYTTVAYHGTKSLREFQKGLADENPELAMLSKRVEKWVDKRLDALARHGMTTRASKASRNTNLRNYLASTKPCRVNVEGERMGSYEAGYDTATVVPYGFVHTLDLARDLDALLDHETRDQFPEVWGAPNGEEGEKKEVPKRGRARGKWASLSFDRTISMNRNATNVLGKTKVHSSTGLAPKRIERLLTDPERRIFERKKREVGGIVLVDQSGSMSLELDDLDRLVNASRGCVVIGYSHGNASLPNIWTLANRGKVASRVREGNGGNGCDRPAFDYALSLRKKGEPVIWVCDGWVTYAHDGFADAEDRLELIRDIRKHGVYMVATIDEGIRALELASSGRRLEARYTPQLAQGIPTKLVEQVWGESRPLR